MEYKDSDQRSFYVPCPHCETYQPLQWHHPDGELSLIRTAITRTVSYRCHHCGELIHEKNKTDMLAAGQWRPRFPDHPARGYHLSGLYSPIGLGLTWAEIFNEWTSSRTDTGRLRRFMNTALGEVFEEAGESIDAGGLLSRLEFYPDQLPPTVRTAGIDVQKDRVELTIIDWAAGEEAWVNDHIIIAGDTATGEVWQELGELLEAVNPAAVGLDTGFNTSQAFTFCAERGWVYPLKGLGGMDRPIAEDYRRRMLRLRYRRKAGHAVYIVGTDSAKSLLYARLRLTESGAGFVHFPNTAAFDDEYFAQLTAEKLVLKQVNNRSTPEWRLTRNRNEALDCFIYALAALRISELTPNATTTPPPAIQTQTATTESSPITPPQPPIKPAQSRRGRFADRWK